MTDSAVHRRKRATGRHTGTRRRLRALLCRTGQGDLTDSCLLLLSSEAEVEHVGTLSEAMNRCLRGEADILFVNMFPISARELTALSIFRGLAPDVWVVALATEDLRASLILAGIADEVLTAGPAPERTAQPAA